MGNIRNTLILIFALFFVINCSDKNEPITDELIVTPTTEQTETKAFTRSVTGNPNRDYYDVVVVDIDRWEICLNVHRVRRNVISYGGHLWYRSGRFVFEGRASATYNPIWDELTVTALDSGWDRGHITYTLKFDDETGTDMDGTFFYYEFPRRVNWVRAWLDKGTIGNHTASSTTAKIVKPPLVHMKKIQTELE